MTVTFDSNIWIEYFAGTKKGEKAREIIKSNEQINTSALSIMEIKTKFEKEGHDYRNRLDCIYSRSRIVPLDKNIAELAASMRIKYKLHTADAIMYATAQIERTTLLSEDNDFKNVPNVEKL